MHAGAEALDNCSGVVHACTASNWVTRLPYAQSRPETALIRLLPVVVIPPVLVAPRLGLQQDCKLFPAWHMILSAWLPVFTLIEFQMHSFHKAHRRCSFSRPPLKYSAKPRTSKEARDLSAAMSSVGSTCVDNTTLELCCTSAFVLPSTSTSL